MGRRVDRQQRPGRRRLRRSDVAPTVVRAWLHIHDDNPDIGRIRAQHPELLSGNIMVRAFQIRPDLDRREVKTWVVSLLAEPATPPDDATPEQLCAHHIAAILRNGHV